MFDPLRFAIAVVPIAAYLLLLGIINLRRRPTLTTGAADAAALGAAVSGAAFVGPIELFRPEAATAEMGPWVWVLLIALYGLVVSLAVLLARPRLVVYNLGQEELRPALAQAVAQVDPQARWAGNNLTLPTLGVSLHVESFELMRHISLKSSGDQQDMDGWRRFARALDRSLGGVAVEPNPRVVSFVALAVAGLTVAVVALQRDPSAVAESLAQLTRF